MLWAVLHFGIFASVYECSEDDAIKLNLKGDCQLVPWNPKNPPKYGDRYDNGIYTTPPLTDEEREVFTERVKEMSMSDTERQQLLNQVADAVTWWHAPFFCTTARRGAPTETTSFPDKPHLTYGDIVNATLSEGKP